MRPLIPLVLASLLIGFTAHSAFAQAPAAGLDEESLRKGEETLRSGRQLQAAIDLHDAGRLDEAIQALEIYAIRNPTDVIVPRTLARWHKERGDVRFKNADMAGAIRDWEEFAKSRPSQRARLWQLGVAYYLNGEYDEGRRLFAEHGTVNPNDIENSIFLYACVGRRATPEAANSQYKTIENDLRSTMEEIQKLYQGKATAEEVIDAVDLEFLSDDLRNPRLFYAHYYIGLWNEVQGNKEAALEHLKKAATEYALPEVEQGVAMGEVARAHYKLRTGKELPRP